MMSRITINLKKSVYKVNEMSHIRPELPSMFSQKSGELRVDSAVQGVEARAPGTISSHPKQATVGYGGMAQMSGFSEEEKDVRDDENVG